MGDRFVCLTWHSDLSYARWKGIDLCLLLVAAGLGEALAPVFNIRYGDTQLREDSRILGLPVAAMLIQSESGSRFAGVRCHFSTNGGRQPFRPSGRLSYPN